MVWYSHLFQNFLQFIVIHTVKGFDLVNKAEIDVFLELSCFFHDPVDVGNLISGSCAFSKTSLNIWKFTVHVLLKPGLENFEHYFASVNDEKIILENSTLLSLNSSVSMYLMTLLLLLQKSLQSCPTLCDPIDLSPQISPIPGILQST